MFTINGKFLCRDTNGQIRVAIETIKELDRIVPKGFVEIVAPYSDYTINDLDRIEIKRVGRGNPHVWEQTTFYRYIKSNNSICINFLNSHPLFRADIAYVHDLVFFAYPQLYKTFYGRIQKIYNHIMETSAAKRAKRIVTVSNFTKGEIIKYLGVDSERIETIYNGWQHMLKIEEDDSIFEQYRGIERGNYFLFVSGITPQKNINWIIDNAKINRFEQYVIVGKKERSTQDCVIELPNLTYMGRIADERLKALMHYCKALVHPAIYEGFGMTPLEAAGAGCKELIVSSEACFTEVYGDCVHYVDPHNPNVILDSLLSENVSDMSCILSKYSWNESAHRLYEIMLSMLC